MKLFCLSISWVHMSLYSSLPAFTYQILKLWHKYFCMYCLAQIQTDIITPDSFWWLYFCQFPISIIPDPDTNTEISQSHKHWHYSKDHQYILKEINIIYIKIHNPICFSEQKYLIRLKFGLANAIHISLW